jgi:hypothetical protein
MIRILIPALLTSLLTLQNLYAQNTLSVPMQKFVCSARLELQGGMNLSRLSAKDLSDSESNRFKPSLNLGVRVHTQLSNTFSFTPGLVFEQRGNLYEYSYDYNEFIEGDFSANLESDLSDAQARTTATMAANSLTNKTTLSYLSIPLLFSYTPLKDLPELRIISGLNPGFLLGRRSKINSFGSESEDMGTENLRSVELGLMAGVGYLIDQKYGINLVYDHGMINTIKEAGDLKSFNRTIRLALIYRLKFNPLFRESYTSQRKNLHFTE